MMRKKVLAILLAAVLCVSLAVGLTGCKEEGNSSQSSAAPSVSASQAEGEESSEAQAETEDSEAKYPVTVTTYDQNGEPVEQVVESCPERVVSVSQANTEILLYLGLGDRIVGTAHRTSTPWEVTAEEYEKLNFLAQDAYPSKEAVIALEPDIILGWGSLFAEDALGPVQDWNEMGISTYLMRNTVPNQGKRNFDYLIEDIRNIGKIFGVEEKSEALIQEIQERLAAVEEKTSQIPEEERPTVLTVQMLKDNEWFARAETDLTANIIELAGGICLDEEYGYASMEVLVDKNPDAILVIDRETKPAADTIAGLKNNPDLANVTAIKNDNFYVISHVSFYCGSLKTIEDIEGLSEMLRK